MNKTPTLLAILDGWGHAKNSSSNPFVNAKTPNLNYLFNNYPNALLDASGEQVGLPQGQMGNSEVGHMSIGSGRIILQDLPKISSEIKSGIIEKNEELKSFVKNIKSKTNKCHIMGLLSDGGIHSHIDHIVWSVQFLIQKGCEVYVHIFLDGRDSVVDSRANYIKQLMDSTCSYPKFKLATISGRHYAMDRDQRWNRTELAFKAIFFGEGLKFENYSDCFNYHKNLNITDEFFIPSIIGDFKKIDHNDGIIMMNFRADRVRQLMEAALIENFSKFNVQNRAKVFALAMSEYSHILKSKMNVLFRSENQSNTLGEVLEKNNLKQLRIAESEKYAHVTFFFNCGKEDAFQGEERILIQSPLVETYDLKPEMSAFELTNVLVTKLEYYDFILLNFANLDMVGHTGNYNAAIKAIEVIDQCVGLLTNKVKELNGDAIITSDHGNIEMMFNSNGVIHTHHTTNLVPIILVSEKFKNCKIRDGNLADIAPTILQLMGINKPTEMIGKTLLELEKV